MIYKLLIVDDEPDLREMIRTEFEVNDWEVFEASNGHDGLALFQSVPDIHAVITDVRMPGGSGLDLLIKIKSLSPQTPVLMLTGFTDILEKEAMTKGALNIVKKPFDLVSIYEMIEGAVKKRGA